MASVLVSYAREDGVFAHQLAKSLSDIGVNVWIDVEDIAPGVKWSTAIQQGLDQSHTMIVIITPESMASKNVEDEWQYYMDEGKAIIPVLLRSARIPFQLRRVQYIDFHQKDYSTALTALLKTLGIEQPQIASAAGKAYDMLQTYYRDWLAFGQRDDQLLSDASLNLILTHIERSDLSPDLFEYLLCSLANTSSDVSINVQKLRLQLDKLPQTSIDELINRLFRRSNSQIREGVTHWIRKLELVQVSPVIIDWLRTESETAVQRVALQVLRQFDAKLPFELAENLFTTSTDWKVRTYALSHLKTDNVLFLISDGTDFAVELAVIAQEVGYQIVTMSPEQALMIEWEVKDFDETLLQLYQLIMLVRGEHYRLQGSGYFYALLRGYVIQGGKLLPTAWVGWETRYNQEFADMLPFGYKEFHEDVRIICRPTSEQIASELFSSNIAYLTSLETLKNRPGSTVLLQTENGIPVFGFRPLEDGVCYYLNTCQHSCSIKDMQSPFVLSPELRDSIKRVLAWIYKEELNSVGG